MKILTIHEGYQRIIHFQTMAFDSFKLAVGVPYGGLNYLITHHLAVSEIEFEPSFAAA